MNLRPMNRGWIAVYSLVQARAEAATGNNPLSRAAATAFWQQRFVLEPSR